MNDAPRPRMQDSVRLSASSVTAAALGSLEALVIEALWELATPVPATVVHRHVVARHECALLSVITVVNRLVVKGLARREKRDDLLHYSAIYDREAFTALVSRRVVEGILSVGVGAIAASFVDVLAERDPAQLAELGRLVRRRLDEQAAGLEPPDQQGQGEG